MEKLQEIELPYLFVLYQAIVIFVISFLSQEMDNQEKSNSERLMQSIAITVIATPIVLGLFILLDRKIGLL